MQIRSLLFEFRPGSYEFDAKRDRKVKFHGSFGGPQTLITSVTIKCNEFGETDIVSNNNWLDMKVIQIISPVSVLASINQIAEHSREIDSASGK